MTDEPRNHPLHPLDDYLAREGLERVTMEDLGSGGKIPVVFAVFAASTVMIFNAQLSSGPDGVRLQYDESTPFRLGGAGINPSGTINPSTFGVVPCGHAACENGGPKWSSLGITLKFTGRIFGALGSIPAEFRRSVEERDGYCPESPAQHLVVMHGQRPG